MNGYLTNLIIFFSALLSFLLVFISIPTILRVARHKNLFDEPGKRRVHKHRVPNLGGLGIFIGILLTYTLYSDLFNFRPIPFMVPALLVIFSIGIKDDIMVTAPMMKLLGQILAAFIIVGLGDLRITDFHGFWGWQPNYLVSVGVSLLLVIFIVNGFNLIDGVDGLAAVCGIVSSVGFSIWFFINGEAHVTILGAILVGSLAGFLYYNVFSKRQKIFMGDAGSMVIGFVLATMAIRFVEFNSHALREQLEFQMNSAPAVAMGILIVPVIDTMRVFFLRISQGNSPFVADKNHIHHRLLTLGFTHFHIALILGGVNLFFIILSYLLMNLGMLKLFAINLSLGFLIFNIPAWCIRHRVNEMKKRNPRHAPNNDL